MESLKLEDLSEDQREIAEIIGAEAYLRLSKVFGGTMIYIGKSEEILRRKNRDRKIRDEFNGANYSELALKYGLSEIWVRNIVSEKAAEIKKAPIKGQMDLSEFLQ